MDFEVRDALPEDAESIARVHTASWQHAYRGLFPDDYLNGLDWRDRLPGWQQQTTAPAPGCRTLVAVNGTGLLGFANAGPPREESLPADRYTELYSIYLQPAERARGVGGALLEHMVQATQGGQLVLWVLEGNVGARGFYERHGFRPDGARKIIERGGHEAPQLRYRLVPG